MGSRSSAPSYTPPPQPMASRGDAGGRRTALLLGGIVTGMVLMALVIVGSVAVSNSDDESTQASPANRRVDRALISEHELYAPLAGYRSWTATSRSSCRARSTPPKSRLDQLTAATVERVA